MANLFNIAALARRTGVAPDTLRKWEQRYGVLRPRRTAGGQRRYTQSDVARVEWLRDRLRDGWRIRRSGKLIHAEATVLSGDSTERASLSLLDGAIAFATVLHVAPDAERKLDAVRALLPESGGASVIGERLTVRLLAPRGLALRRALSPIIALLSSAGSIPRLWTL